MKNLLIILMCLMVASCATKRQKNKEKIKTEIQQKETGSSATSSVTEVMATTSKKDSTVQTIDQITNRSAAIFAQNLSLKNNGKCTDGGEIRFLKFTDAQGNQTEVPVNDNTDLDYSSSAELEKENSSLKSRIESLTSENRALKSQVAANSETNYSKQLSALQQALKKDAETERNSIMSYVWCGLLSIIGYVTAKFLIKTYFKP